MCVCVCVCVCADATAVRYLSYDGLLLPNDYGKISATQCREAVNVLHVWLILTAFNTTLGAEPTYLEDSEFFIVLSTDILYNPVR